MNYMMFRSKELQMFNKKGIPAVLQLGFLTSHYRLNSSAQMSPQIAIVGSGPAGFYTAQKILKKHPSAFVDIYEKFPVPFGLVRFGVAPDHPEVKNVINTFTQTAKNVRCTFIGNVNIGSDVTLDELRHAYTAVILAYGAEDDKKLNIPGEDLNNVLSARRFVGWYNGLPGDVELQPNLNTDTVIVLGNGNVALDVARILLTPTDNLETTDITAHALKALAKSRVKRVILIGRRGPLQVAFTTAELREMTKLPKCHPVFDISDFKGLEDILNSLPRPRKRLTELMLKTATQLSNGVHSHAGRECVFKFLRSPVEFISDDNGSVQAVKFAINSLKGESIDNQEAVCTNLTETIETGLVLRSIGYKGSTIDSNLPFNQKLGHILNDRGKVHNFRGVYCSGWVKRGPVGVIVSTMNDAFETADSVLNDLISGDLLITEHRGKTDILQLLDGKGVNPVFFEDWEKIDLQERVNGEKIGKAREKIVNFKEMLSITAKT